MNRRQAVDAARDIINGPRLEEAKRLDMIAKALRPRVPTVMLPKKASPVMQALAAKAQTNFLPLVIRTYSQVMKVGGYQSLGRSDNAPPWEHWQTNGLDARQVGIHWSALAYGVSYATALPGDRGPAFHGYSPRQMTALYQDSVNDEFPMLALEVDGSLIRLFDEERVWYIGAENEKPRSGFANTVTQSIGPKFDYIEDRPHKLGVCPVVRFRDRMLLEGEEQYGIVEPLITIQERIDETTFGGLVAQYYAAFRQRYVIGWIPDDEATQLRASASDLWAFANSEVKVGDFAETDLTRYLESKDSAVRDMASIAQVPAQNLGINALSNISAETLAGLEAGKDRNADEITTSFGESWELWFRLAASIAGDTASAEDYSAQVRWKDATARSLAQTVDALGKMVQMLGVPREAAWGRIPGTTDQDIETWRGMAEDDAQRQALADPLAAFMPIPNDATSSQQIAES